MNRLEEKIDRMYEAVRSEFSEDDLIVWHTPQRLLPSGVRDGFETGVQMQYRRRQAKEIDDYVRTRFLGNATVFF